LHASITPRRFYIFSEYLEDDGDFGSNWSIFGTRLARAASQTNKAVSVLSLFLSSPFSSHLPERETRLTHNLSQEAAALGAALSLF